MTSTATSGKVLGQHEVGEYFVLLTRHAPGLRLRTHDHAEASINVLLSGSCREQVGRRTLSAAPGSVVITPAGAHHWNQFGSMASVSLLIQVPLETLANLGDSAKLFGEPRTLNRPDILLPANRVVAALRSARSLAQPILDIYELIERLAGGGVSGRRLPQPWLARVREMLEANIAGPIALNVMAAESGVSAVALSKAFRQAYGCSATEFIRRARIARARESLLASNRPLVVIAAELGFADQSHFTRAFKTETGLSPGQFRRLAPRAL